ncbi:hypothetical protein UPYG_G00225550 [Umbra pygmaea]|uniref:C2H2-type domain-containing protein n=1 Tax=Umbra pygmaea TaxID=75934 RepID=A0ABD0WWT6_UMBPY
METEPKMKRGDLQTCPLLKNLSVMLTDYRKIQDTSHLSANSEMDLGSECTSGAQQASQPPKKLSVSLTDCRKTMDIRNWLSKSKKERPNPRSDKQMSSLASGETMKHQKTRAKKTIECSDYCGKHLRTSDALALHQAQHSGL